MNSPFTINVDDEKLDLEVKPYKISLPIDCHVKDFTNWVGFLSS